MRKIGIAALTLLAVATAACTESPVGIHAESTRAALNVGTVEVEGDAQGEGTNVGDPEFVAMGDEDPGLTTQENPGLGLSGN